MTNASPLHHAAPSERQRPTQPPEHAPPGTADLPDAADPPDPAGLTEAADLTDSAGGVVVVREPRDLLGAVPYLVGYHPQRSLVVVGLSRGRLEFTLRTELPDNAEELLAIVGRIGESVAGPDVDAAMLVAYGRDEEVRPVVMSVLAALTLHDIAVHDALRYHAGRYWSYLCTDPRCCPPDGTPVDLTTTSAAAAAIAAGWTASPDRNSYERQLDPVRGPARVSMRTATELAHRRLIELILTADDEDTAEAVLVRSGSEVLDAVVDAHRDGRPAEDDDVAWLSLLVSCAEVNEVAWRRLGRDDATLRLYRAVWLDVVRRAEPDLIAAPGTLFAYVSWRLGEPSLARITLDRVLEEEPTDRVARLLEAMLLQGLPPCLLPGWPDPPELSTLDSSLVDRSIGLILSGSDSASRPPVRSGVSRSAGARRHTRSSSARAGSRPT
jgi:hypothetical protein